MNYEKFEEITEHEYLKFDRIPEDARLSNCPDLCALMYLDKHFPSAKDGDMIGSAEHDVIYLEVSFSDITEEQCIYLSRCGVHWEEEFECLAIFV